MWLITFDRSLALHLALSFVLHVCATYYVSMTYVLALELVASIHRTYWLAPRMQRYFVMLRLNFEKINARIMSMHWTSLRLPIEKKKQDALWPVVNFNFNVVDCVVMLLPQAGHIVWLARNEPHVIVAQAFVCFVILRVSKPPIHDMDTMHTAWSDYDFYCHNRVVDKLHNRVNENIAGMEASAHLEETARCNYRCNIITYNAALQIAQQAVFLLCAPLTGDLVRYTHCAHNLMGASKSIGQLYMNYKEAAHYYRELEDALRAPLMISKARDIDIRRYEGQFILIVGRSGCGKSTFLDRLVDTLPRCVYLEQSPEISWDHSLIETVSMRGDVARAKKMLSIVAPDLPDAPLRTYSKGEKALVLLARALYLLKGGWLILDEADSAISADRAVPAFLRIMDYCKRKRITLVAVSHSSEIKQLPWHVVLNF